MRRSMVLMVAACLAGALPVLAPAAPAGAVASATFDLGVDYDVSVPLGGIAVDAGTGRVFVAVGNAVLVRSGSGANVGTVTGIPGAGDLVAAGGAVYVVARSTSAIKRIDPTSLSVTATWPTFPVNDLQDVAVANGRVWATGTDPGGEGYSALAAITPATGAVAVTGLNLSNDLSVTASPDGLVLALQKTDSSFPEVFLWDVSGATPTLRDTDMDFAYNSGFNGGLAFSPDGTKVILATANPYKGVEYRTSDLHRTGIEYPTDAFPRGAATTSAAGGLVAVGSSDDEEGVSVYRLGAPAKVASHPFPETAGNQPQVATDGVVFSADGARVYALRQGVPGDAYLLTVIELGAKVTKITPTVLGTRGGARVTATGSGLDGATATFGGVAATSPSGPSTARAFTAPALPAGPAAVVVRNGVGFSVTVPGGARVVDLGPFRDGPAFVDRQYVDAVGRASTASEQTTQLAALTGGTAPGKLVVDLVHRDAYDGRRAPLIRLYQAIFLRPPDTSGLTYWLGKMQSGTSLVRVAATFAASNEFKTRYGSKTNPQFVDLVYENVLGRPADPGGRAYWIKKLDTGTSRGVLITGFSESGEYTRKMTGQVDVTLLHLAMLRRTPTPAELAAALAALADGGTATTIADGLLRSPAYATRIG
jgi:hypothetical protein